MAPAWHKLAVIKIYDPEYTPPGYERLKNFLSFWLAIAQRLPSRPVSANTIMWKFGGLTGGGLEP